MNAKEIELFVRIEKAIQHLSTQIQMGHGVEQQWIERAEQALSLRFPDSFRYFLLKYGGGYVGGEDIIGLCDLEPEPDVFPDDLVYFTLQERKTGLNYGYVLLVNNDGDQQFYLDTSVMNQDNECAVIEINIEERCTPKLYAESFAEFLLRRINFHFGQSKGF